MKIIFPILEELINKGLLYGKFTFKRDEDLSKQSSSVPHEHGVYIIFKNSISFENILYIGNSGRLYNNGTFAKQTLHERINKKQDKDTYRQSFFNNHIDEKDVRKLIFQWFQTTNEINKFLPGYIEACLIQEYYRMSGKLPSWNKHF